MIGMKKSLSLRFGDITDKMTDVIKMYPNITLFTKEQADAVVKFCNDRKAEPTDDVLVVHCFPKGTLVEAPIPVPIEDATEVYGHDGKIHKVVKRIERQYDGKMLEIKGLGNLPIKCTPDHPFLVLKPYKTPRGRIIKPYWKGKWSGMLEHYIWEPYRWVKAKDIEIGDFLVSPKIVMGSSAELPVFKNRKHALSQSVKNLVPNYETAWMIGNYVADGGTLGKKGVSICTSRMVDANRIKRVFDSLGVEAKIKNFNTYQRVIVNSVVIEESFRDWFGKSVKKKFPEWVFDDKWNARALIEGYIDGDGHRRKRGSVVTTTISPILSRQLSVLLKVVGEYPSVRYDKRYSGYKTDKQIIKTEWVPNSFNEGRAKNRYLFWNGDNYLIPVEAISKSNYKGIVCNLEVEDVNSYLVNGVAVHNCDAGISRSGAVAEFAAEVFGIPFDVFFRQNPQIMPNSFVRRLLRESAGLTGESAFQIRRWSDE
jgi:intein/homing endonuclease/predicted protein tyrosine phosphatase